jgi:hypothetical protein
VTISGGDDEAGAVATALKTPKTEALKTPKTKAR